MSYADHSIIKSYRTGAGSLKEVFKIIKRSGLPILFHEEWVEERNPPQPHIVIVHFYYGTDPEKTETCDGNTAHNLEKIIDGLIGNYKIG